MTAARDYARELGKRPDAVGKRRGPRVGFHFRPHRCPCAHGRKSEPIIIPSPPPPIEPPRALALFLT
jgi:hypothetical protein